MSFSRRRDPGFTTLNSITAQPRSRWDVVTTAIRDGAYDDAAAELVKWRGAVVTDDVEDNNSHRTDCRQLVDRRRRSWRRPVAEPTREQKRCSRAWREWSTRPPGR